MSPKPKIGEIRRGKEIGRTGNRKWIWHACEKCGKERWVMLRLVHPLVLNSRYCMSCGVKKAWENPEMILKQSESRKGDKCYAWKGGKARTRHRGYVYIKLRPDSPFYIMAKSDIKISGAYVAEHRLVVAQQLKRCLESWEVVHHKNGIRDDNRIENLELTTNGRHIKDHSKGYIDGYNKGYRDGLNEARMVRTVQEQTGIPCRACQD
jgi:hypothetical protein